MAVTTIDTAPGIDIPSMLKEAVITAFVALLLTIPLVGFRTFEQSGMLTWGTDFTSVAIAVGLVFIGRIGLILSREGRPEPVLWIAGAVFVILLVDWILLDIGIVALLHTEALRVIAIGGSGVLAIRAGMAMGAARSLLSADEREKRMDAISAGMLDATRWLGPILIVIAFALPVLFPDRALLGNVIVVLIYTMLAWGLNIIVGLAGLLDLGYVAFYAVGAYSFALMSQWTDLGFWTLLPLTGALSASFGLLLGYPVLRLRGDYFAIVTLGFGEIIRVVLLNWSEVTGGPNGILAVPRPTFFGQTFTGLDRVIYLYYIILVMALVVNFFSIRIRKLPIGRAWEALREDDVACQSLGINRTKIKLAAFGISAMFGGFAGCFFATYNGSVFPESFTFIESAIILAIVVLGGMGNQLGIVLAAILLIGLPQTEQLRGLVEYRMLAFGLGMVFIMIWRPKGLLSHRDPSVLLHGTRRLLGGVKR